MSEEKKRIFVGGISADITEEELKSKFKKFGDVKSVELKTKKDVLGGPPNTFAFINISLTSDSLYECFTTLGNTKWKGNYLRLEVAKENFLDRLKKERECQQTASVSRETEFGTPTFSTEKHKVVKKWDQSKHKRTSERFVPECVNKIGTGLKKTLANRRPVGDDATSDYLPPFKGFSFTGKGDFDFLFETSAGNVDRCISHHDSCVRSLHSTPSLEGCVSPSNKRKRTREVGESKDSETKVKHQRSDDLMNRMESFSSIWKDEDDCLPDQPETEDVEEQNIAGNHGHAVDSSEDVQVPFQTSVSSYIRLDPTLKIHQKYILSPSKKERKKATLEEDNDAVVPKDKFYKVVDDLKNRFQKKKNDENAEGSFSLLAALGSQAESQDFDDINDAADEQFEESWNSWNQQEPVHRGYKGNHDQSISLIVAGDPRLEDGVAFISEKTDKMEMLKNRKEQKPMLKILWKKKHKDALREDKGVRVLRGTSLGFPGRGRRQKMFNRKRS